MEALGSPQKAYRTIHVVGTNGKTSTTRFISALLEAQGHKVGAYVSPHLISLAERQMVDSVPSTDEEFCELMARIRPVVDEVEKTFEPGESLTQFEVLTAAAFLYFKEQGCDVAVIEAGLGGRLDATAVISSEVQVVTSIGREHTELLGDTPSAILKEKAAVIPPARPGGRRGAGSRPQGGAQGDLRRSGRRMPLLWRRSRRPGRSSRRLVRHLRALRLLHGPAPEGAGRLPAGQRGGGRGGRRAVHRRRTGCRAVRQALAATQAPGRLEIISTQPLCIFDGSHNPPGMEETMRSLDQILERRRLIAVVSILRDKEAVEMIRHLAPRCDIIFATQSSSPRALSRRRAGRHHHRAGQEARRCSSTRILTRPWSAPTVWPPPTRSCW